MTMRKSTMLAMTTMAVPTMVIVDRRGGASILTGKKYPALKTY
jgi:hypothetical protein